MSLQSHVRPLAAAVVAALALVWGGAGFASLANMRTQHDDIAATAGTIDGPFVLVHATTGSEDHQLAESAVSLPLGVLTDAIGFDTRSFTAGSAFSQSVNPSENIISVQRGPPAV